MKDVVDFLNYEGLTVSPITDPTTGIQPLINYDYTNVGDSTSYNDLLGSIKPRTSWFTV